MDKQIDNKEFTPEFESYLKNIKIFYGFLNDNIDNIIQYGIKNFSGKVYKDLVRDWTGVKWKDDHFDSGIISKKGNDYCRFENGITYSQYELDTLFSQGRLIEVKNKPIKRNYNGVKLKHNINGYYLNLVKKEDNYYSEDGNIYTEEDIEYRINHNIWIEVKESDLQVFYKEVTDWLLPLGYIKIFQNHPSLELRQFDFIKDQIRIQCFMDKSEGNYYKLSKTIYIKHTSSLISGKYSLDTDKDKLDDIIESFNSIVRISKL